MTALFAFALVLGGGLIALSLLGDLFGSDAGDVDAGVDIDGHFGGDFDTHLGGDVDGHLGGDLGGHLTTGAPDGDLHAGGGSTAGAAGTAGAEAFRILTVRNLTYFLFGFGATGVALQWLAPELSLLATTVVALGAGAVSGLVAALVFGWVRSTDSGAQESESSFVGCEARVLLPLGHDRVGQVAVRRSDREHVLRARPFDARAASPEQWRRVLVIEMVGGTALVSPEEELAPADPGALIQP